MKRRNKRTAIAGLCLLMPMVLLSGCSGISKVYEEIKQKSETFLDSSGSGNNNDDQVRPGETENAIDPTIHEPTPQESIPPTFSEVPDLPEDHPAPSDTDTSTEQIEETDGAGTYILPESNTKYLSEADLANISKEELKIARNEIYARHGRKFQSQDLQEYFDSKAWYQGTIEPANFSESLLNDFEKKNIKLIQKAEETAQSFSELSNLSDAPSKKIIDRYGYENGYSVLSFHIIEGTVKDCGEYYQVDATYQQGIEAPADLKEGDQITLTFNELTGETRTLVFRENHFCPLDSDNSYDGFYYYPSSNGKSVVLYHDSDDRMDKPVYEGKLYVRKDATDEVDIMRQVRPVTKEILSRENWYNGVYFDQKGYVTRLVYYGD